MNIYGCTPETQGGYISKEQFYKECHISKRTALWLIQEGLVPAIDTGRKTDRYLIARSAVDGYLYAREIEPEKYRYRRNDSVIASPEVSRSNDIRETHIYAALQRMWEDLPDLLRRHEVVALLGYPEKRIKKWRQTMGLKTMTISHTLYFPKKYLIDFVLSVEFQAVCPKSPEHKALLRRITHEGT